MGWNRAILLAGGALLSVPNFAIAHGAAVHYQPVEAIELQANYSSGEPMAKAQVSIFAPNNATNPWQIGMTDKAGRFIFRPDHAQPGDWEVQVRQAGHGELVTIPVEAEPVAETDDDPAGAKMPTAASPPASAANPAIAGYSPLPPGLMVASVLWGCVGTALFFAQRR